MQMRTDPVCEAQFGFDVACGSNARLILDANACLLMPEAQDYASCKVQHAQSSNAKARSSRPKLDAHPAHAGNVLVKAFIVLNKRRKRLWIGLHVLDHCFSAVCMACPIAIQLVSYGSEEAVTIWCHLQCAQPQVVMRFDRDTVSAMQPLQ